ncbi:MAG: class I SAM-dependent methyltransferase [Proteobacteria bacterium]|nr:class I SAM-dependent methyltransferase [Pseudomonadota bacterium]
MEFYDKVVLPRLIDSACGSNSISRQRAKVVPLAEGRVLEIGIGTGLNIPFYNRSKVTHLWGLEPSATLRQIAQKRAEDINMDVEFIDLPGEEIPLDRNSADTILITYTLCTITEAIKALDGMRKVLKPGGKLIFCEHGKAPDERVRKWQDRLNPLWNKIGGGCNLNRDIPDIITSGGFTIDKLETMYLPGFKIATFNYWGISSPK